jgi:hypothetical protein
MFATAQVRWGKPIVVPPDASPELIEARRLDVEKALQQLMEQNDHDVSRR